MLRELLLRLFYTSFMMLNVYLVGLYRFWFYQVTMSTLTNKQMLEAEEALGDSHQATAAQTPMRENAFALSDSENRTDQEECVSNHGHIRSWPYRWQPCRNAKPCGKNVCERNIWRLKSEKAAGVYFQQSLSIWGNASWKTLPFTLHVSIICFPS